MYNLIEKRVRELQTILELTLNQCSRQIEVATQLIVEAYQNEKGVFIFGNGGSAADAQHIVGELNGRYLRERSGLKAQALVGDAATLTCIANDYGYEQIFARQLEANAVAGDIAWGLSTSGNSPSVINALTYAKKAGLKTIALTGEGGGRCAEFADVLMTIPSAFTPHVQEVGVLVYHCICERVETSVRP